MIYTLTLNPAWDLTYLTGKLTFGLNRAKSCSGKAGGKGINVSRAIRAAGGDCGTLAVLAGETGQTIAGALAAEGMRPVIFSTEGETRTNISAIGEDGGSLEINGPGASVNGNCRRALEGWLQDHLKTGDILCLCGSLPPMSDTRAGDYYTRLCSIAGAAGAEVVLDCSGAALTDALRSGYPPVLIKPNASELSELYRSLTGAQAPEWKKDGGADPDVLRQMAKTAVDLERTAVLCTLGRLGAVWLDNSTTVFVPAVKVSQPKAEKGAGDTYLGVFLWSLYGGGQAKLRTAMEKAGEAAARLVAGEV